MLDEDLSNSIVSPLSKLVSSKSGAKSSCSHEIIFNTKFHSQEALLYLNQIQSLIVRRFHALVCT